MKNIKITILSLTLFVVGQMSFCEPPTPQDVAQGIIKRVYSEGNSTVHLESQMNKLFEFKKSFTEEKDPVSYAGMNIAIDILSKAINKQPSLDQNLYQISTERNDVQAARDRTSESLISPEMQWEVLSYLGEKDVIVNKNTGLVQNIPSTQQLMSDINQKLQGSITNGQKESMKDALHTMLEATDIAIFVASIEAAYKDQNFMLYQIVDQQLVVDLNDQKLGIQAAMNAVTSTTPIDPPAQEASYFSWFYQPAPVSQVTTMEHPMITFNQNSPTFSIPAKLMKPIIQSNDYKTMEDPAQAANLLFKECFIAQQHHLKNQYRINNIKINLQAPVTGPNYIYTNFPNIYNKAQNSYPICDIAKNRVPSYPERRDLLSPVSVEQQEAHQLLLDIRQSIQTAIFIANRRSNVNVGYLLPSSVVSYLDGIVGELTKYDAQLSILCKDPRYGATPEDTYQSEQYAMITKAVAGVGITAIVGGGLYAYGPSVAGYASSNLSNAGAWASSWWSGAAPTGNQTNSGSSEAGQVAASTNTGTQSSMWERTKDGYEAVKHATGSQSTTGRALSYLQYAGAVSSTAGLVNQAMGNPVAGYVVSDLKTIGAAANLVGVLNAKGGMDVINRLFTAYMVLPKANLNVSNYMNPAQQKATGTPPIDADKLLIAFDKIIADSAMQRLDLINVIENVGTFLLTNKKTNVTQLTIALRNLEKKYEDSPVITEALQAFITKHSIDESMNIAL